MIFGERRFNKMNFKKFGLLFMLVFLLVGSMGITLAEITQEDIGRFSQDTVDTITAATNPILRWILGESLNTGELALKVLAFLMVAIVIYGILDSIKILGDGADKKWLNLTLGIIVATIGIRFMPENLLTALTAPSSAFVAVIFLGIPFLAFFFVVKKMDSSFARRLAWIMYTILIFAIASYNMGWLVWLTGTVPENSVKTAFLAWGWIYYVFALVALALAFLDGTIQRFMRGINAERYANNVLDEQGDRLLEKKAFYEKLANDTNVPQAKRDNALRQIGKINAALASLDSQQVGESRRWGIKQILYIIIIGGIILLILIIAAVLRFV